MYVTERHPYLCDQPYDAAHPYSGSGEACVYLMASPLLPSRVKIGRTTNLQVRISSAKGWLPDIEVAFEHRGTKEFSIWLEHQLHSVFDEFRVTENREWFDFSASPCELEALKLGCLPIALMEKVIAQRDPRKLLLSIRYGDALDRCQPFRHPILRDPKFLRVVMDTIRFSREFGEPVSVGEIVAQWARTEDLAAA